MWLQAEKGALLIMVMPAQRQPDPDLRISKCFIDFNHLRSPFPEDFAMLAKHADRA
jgi:hypothetical protein